MALHLRAASLVATSLVAAQGVLLLAALFVMRAHYMLPSRGCFCCLMSPQRYCLVISGVASALEEEVSLPKAQGHPGASRKKLAAALEVVLLSDLASAMELPEKRAAALEIVLLSALASALELPEKGAQKQRRLWQRPILHSRRSTHRVLPSCMA